MTVVWIVPGSINLSAVAARVHHIDIHHLGRKREKRKKAGLDDVREYCRGAAASRSEAPSGLPRRAGCIATDALAWQMVLSDNPSPPFPGTLYPTVLFGLLQMNRFECVRSTRCMFWAAWRGRRYTALARAITRRPCRKLAVVHRPSLQLPTFFFFSVTDLYQGHSQCCEHCTAVQSYCNIQYCMYIADQGTSALLLTACVRRSSTHHSS